MKRHKQIETLLDQHCLSKILATATKRMRNLINKRRWSMSHSGNSRKTNLLVYDGRCRVKLQFWLFCDGGLLQLCVYAASVLQLVGVTSSVQHFSTLSVCTIWRKASTRFSPLNSFNCYQCGFLTGQINLLQKPHICIRIVCVRGWGGVGWVYCSEDHSSVRVGHY